MDQQQTQTYLQLGYDIYFRRPIPTNTNNVSAANYEAQNEDEHIITVSIQDGAITSKKIKDLEAEKIKSGTISVGLNIGGPTVRIIGDDPSGGAILFYNNSIPSILIGSPDITDPQ